MEEGKRPRTPEPSSLQRKVATAAPAAWTQRHITILSRRREKDDGPVGIAGYRVRGWRTRPHGIAPVR
jgi:hypothetical protein